MIENRNSLIHSLIYGTQAKREELYPDQILQCEDPLGSVRGGLKIRHLRIVLVGEGIRRARIGEKPRLRLKFGGFWRREGGDRASN